MSRTLTDNHRIHGIPESIVDFSKPFRHLTLCNEGLDNPKAPQGFIQLRHDVSPLSLSHHRLTFQFTAYRSHNPTGQRKNDKHEQCQLPTYGKQRNKTNNQSYRVANQHIKRTRQRILHHRHIRTHSGDDIPLAFLREKAQR